MWGMYKLNNFLDSHRKGGCSNLIHTIYTAFPIVLFVATLFNGHTFCQITWFVYIRSPYARRVVGQQLQGYGV